MSAGPRRDRKAVLARDADAAHRREQPFHDRALGIVVERGHALLRVRALPALPDRGRASFRHRQPAGDLLVLEQPIRRFKVIVGEHIQDQRRRKKARAEPPAVVLQRFDQPLFRKFGLLFVQQLHIQRPDKLRLPVGVQRVGPGGDQLTIGRRAALGIAAEFFCIFLMAELVRDLAHQAHDVRRVGRRDLGVGIDEVLPAEASADLDGLGPLAVALAHVDEIFPRLFGESDLLGEDRRGFADASFHEAGVLRHAVVGLAKDRFVLIDLRVAPGDQHAHVRPADRAVHRPHIEVRAALRRDVRQSAVLFLPVVDVAQVLPGEGREAEEIGRAREEELRVACPAVALARRAVGGDVEVVALGRPDRGLEEAVEQLVGAFEPAGALEIGIDGVGREVLGPEFHVRFNENVLEAEDGEGRFIFVQALGAGVVHLLQRRGFAAVGKLDVLLGELAVLVQQLAEAQEHALPGVRAQGEGGVALDVLPEIQDLFAARRCDQLGLEALMLPHGDVVGGRGDDLVLRELCPAAVRGRKTRVDGLAVLVVGKEDRPVVRPVPALVAHDGLPPPVFVFDLELREQLRLRAVLVHDAVGAAGAAIPAVGELHRQLVFALAQQPRNVVALVLHALAVIGIARRHHEAADSFAADARLVEAAGRDVQPRLPDRHFHRKTLAEAVDGTAFFRIDLVVSRDPLRLPGADPHFEEGLAPLARLALLVPETDAPVHALALAQQSGIDRLHRGALDPAAVPVFGDDLIRRLLHAAIAVPHQTGFLNVDPDGVEQVFRS